MAPGVQLAVCHCIVDTVEWALNGAPCMWGKHAALSGEALAGKTRYWPMFRRKAKHQCRGRYQTHTGRTANEKCFCCFSPALTRSSLCTTCTHATRWAEFRIPNSLKPRQLGGVDKHVWLGTGRGSGRGRARHRKSDCKLARGPFKSTQSKCVQLTSRATRSAHNRPGLPHEGGALHPPPLKHLRKPTTVTMSSQTCTRPANASRKTPLRNRAWAAHGLETWIGSAAQCPEQAIQIPRHRATMALWPPASLARPGECRPTIRGSH